MGSKDKTMTIKEVADYLNISNQMVYNLIRDRKLEAFKVGSALRILPEDLQEYIDDQKREFLKSDHPVENSDENIFLVDKLSFRREEFQLRDISFSMPRGRIMSLLGPSGSGKTMLLKAVAGLNKTDGGCVYLGSKRLDTLSSRERNIGFVFEDYALMPNRSGRGNIRFPLEVMKKKKIEIDPAVNELAADLHLSSHDLDSLVKEMPEGIKQMIAIAKADIRDIDLLIMDEPLSRLDSSVRLQMRSFIKDLVTSLGKTTLISLHDPEMALALSDYLGIIDEGKLIQFGPALEVYKNPQSITAFEMTSRYAVNRLEVTVEDNMIEDFLLPAGKPDGRYDLMIRGDEVNLASTGIPARAVARHPLDNRRVITTCESPWGDLELVLPPDIPEDFRFIPNNFALF